MAINVFTRVKDGNIPIHSRTKNGCILQIPSKTKQIACHLNDVWQSGTTNAEIFANLIEKSSIHRDNYWVAFGYTGSGKSYTILGLLEQLLRYFLNIKCVQIITILRFIINFEI
mgnify:CR=1 FL=1